MVNKAVLGVLGVVVFASLGVGVLIGMQLGGGGVADGAAGGPSDGTATAAGSSGSTPPANGSANASTGNGSAAGTESDQSGSTEQRKTIPPRQFDEETIGREVLRAVNEERASRDMETFSMGSKTGEQVVAMATNHSVRMANAGAVGHEVDGNETHERYRAYGLRDRCTFQHEKGYVMDPGQRQFAEDFEVLNSTVAGREYQSGGETRYNGDERAVARAIVDAWMNDSESRKRLFLDGPTILGVGVEVTQNGTVYATGNLCA